MFSAFLELAHNSRIYQDACNALEALANSNHGCVWIESPDGSIFQIPQGAKIQTAEYRMIFSPVDEDK